MAAFFYFDSNERRRIAYETVRSGVVYGFCALTDLVNLYAQKLKKPGTIRMAGSIFMCPGFLPFFAEPKKSAHHPAANHALLIRSRPVKHNTRLSWGLLVSILERYLNASPTPGYTYVCNHYPIKYPIKQKQNLYCLHFI